MILPTGDNVTGEQTTWTIGDLLDWTAGFLGEKGIESPRLDAEVLLAEALKCNRIDLYGVRHGEIASSEVRTRYRELIRKRLEGCPVAYLVGRKEFYSLRLEVTPAVLIPRPDSELVVLECLELAARLSEPRIVDIGTGSGNLAIAIAKNHTTARVVAIDKSQEALEVARRNAERHEVADRIKFLLGDLFEPLSEPDPFDFVVSNPPYIPHEDLKSLERGVRDFEPRKALDGGPSGFDVFERLVSDARKHLRIGGWLIVEIGSPQEQGARDRIAAHAEYELAETVKDYSGHPRVVRAKRV